MASSRRFPFSPIDEAIHNLCCRRREQPWSVHFEIFTAGRMEDGRLRSAAHSALEVHPMARVRQAAWRASDHRYHWEISQSVELDILDVVNAEGPKQVDDIRAVFLSRLVPLQESPPFRLTLIHAPDGDRLILNLNHAAGDGLSAARLLRSIVRAYNGDPDPVPATDPLTARQRVSQLSGVPVAKRIAHLRALSAAALDATTAPTRIVGQGGEPRPGFGFEMRLMPAEITSTFNPRRHAQATVNDLLLAALHHTIDGWNHSRGAEGGRIALMMPVNLRPRRSWYEFFGNFSLWASISSTPEDRRDPAALMVAIASQTRRIKDEGTADALLELLNWAHWLPIWLKRAVPALSSLNGDRFVGSAVLSNLGRVEEQLVVDGAGPVSELWFSPPAQMPLGMALGTATIDGAWHLTFRYCRELFDADAAQEFADRYQASLEVLG